MINAQQTKVNTKSGTAFIVFSPSGITWHFVCGDGVMKQTHSLLLVAAAVLTGLACVLQSDPVKIKGSVIFFGLPYANANHLESRPVAGKKFYVRSFDLSKKYIGPVIDSFVSDSAGKFSVYLQPGHYSFISAESAKSIALDKNFKASECDSACFKKQLQAGEAWFRVDAEKNVELHIHVDSPF